MATENENNLKDTDKVYMHSDIVKFKVEYPKDYKKKKHHKDGDVIDLHKIQAENWQERSLGKIVK